MMQLRGKWKVEIKKEKNKGVVGKGKSPGRSDDHDQHSEGEEHGPVIHVGRSVRGIEIGIGKRG